MHILGARGTHSVSGQEYLEFGGRTSCYVLKKDDHAIMLDCGTGMYQSKEILKDCKQVDIILSHLHYDHIIGLLKFVFPVGCTVNIYAEFEKWGGIDFFKGFFEVPFWPVSPGDFKYNDLKEKIQLRDDVSLELFSGNHPNYASIVRVELGDIGFCFATDYEHSDFVFPSKAIEGCSYLLYDGTFSPEEYDLYKGWGHSDWKHGNEIAKKYNVKNLLIIHHDPMKTDDDLNKLEKDAKAINKNINFARENVTMDIVGDEEELKWAKK